MRGIEINLRKVLFLSAEQQLYQYKQGLEETACLGVIKKKGAQQLHAFFLVV